MSLIETAKDRPSIVTAAAATLTAIHLALDTFVEAFPDIWSGFAGAKSDALAVYLGLSGGSAILAGFAGVVVIYGLSVDTVRFRTYRLEAGVRLVANWVSISSAGFLAAGIALVAAVLSIGPAAWLGPWLFEFALLCAIHGTLRLLWLLRQLFMLKRYDDADAHAEANKRSASSMFNQLR